MQTECPDTNAILKQLKDFQRDTVEFVFRRMYKDPDCQRRFLIADEVGLGKTLVARGLIAKAIDHLWDRTDRIDVVYVCSNADIARQNINRLNVTGHDDFTLSSRITLLPITVGGMQHRRLNFISFTPGTSFELKNSSGRSDERELLYWLLDEPWSLRFNKSTQVLRGNKGIEDFRKRVESFCDRNAIHPGMAEQFAKNLSLRADLRAQFDAVCEEMPRANATVLKDVARRRNELVGQLRKLLAQTCLHWLEPDLIILDEFQRFKHLLQGDEEDATDAAQLAEHLFNYQADQNDPATAARVLLLSATPYKMYTLSQEAEQDDHYADFQRTLDFLMPDLEGRSRFRELLQHYREELYRLSGQQVDGLIAAKHDLERSLRQVMVRTERLALAADRNGMLVEIENRPRLAAKDLERYVALQQVAKSLGHDDVMEYWKSAPYLINFMEEYDFKRGLADAAKNADISPDLLKAVQGMQGNLLRREDIERYRQLDPANARLRGLHEDLIGRETWRLLWIPPALPYYQGVGPFAEPQLAGFTKRLVFSNWRVVPKAIAAVLSYEAERSMMQSFQKKARNTAEARKKRRPLLRFTFSKGRPTGMPVLGMVYPCQVLAERFDPLALCAAGLAQGTPPAFDDLLQQVEGEIDSLLAPLVRRAATSGGPVDESWYWAGPLLLDLQDHAHELRSWFENGSLSQVWLGDISDQDASRGWSRHVSVAHDMIQGKTELGPPPSDLARTLAKMALAGPGCVAWRALARITHHRPGAHLGLRSSAAPLAHAFLRLFNIPEVMALLRDRNQEAPYWKAVLQYCVAGNLQSVIDEYAHILVDARGLNVKPASAIAEEVAKEIQRSLALRTATAQADLMVVGKRRFKFDEPVRIRTRFAMRFGDQEAEDSSEPTRADHVRAAFNSPFWPFVLTTTSVGQEGLDFHNYCHAVVHWNLPSNPVDMEQREGRVHRYKGHALRKNIAHLFAPAIAVPGDPWEAMFASARRGRSTGENDLFPFWVAPDGVAKIERHVPMIPHSREVRHHASLHRALVLYRMVFGQNRQEDLVNFLLSRLGVDEAEKIVDLCRIDLSPPIATSSVTSAQA